jgi:hypothetical protein
MPARIPVQRKTPFAIDPRPLREATTAQAGLLCFSRALRSLGLPGLVEANLDLKHRRRGQAEAQYVESILLLQIAGGDCPEDITRLRQDAALCRGLGFEPPGASALRRFLGRFHDEQLEQMRPPRHQQKSFIVPASAAVEDLQRVQAGLVGRIARAYRGRDMAQRVATVDGDATIVESHNRNALPHYQGGRGYQPMAAVWAEADLVLADQWRDGNVPAHQAPLDCVRQAFGSLPEGIKKRFFRGDSACHESGLLDWLSDPAREQEPGGPISFCISAVMSPELAKALRALPEKRWITFGTEPDGTLRQWAEVEFVPSEAYEAKDGRPLRYVGLRLLKAQGELFGDGSDRHFHAVLSNRWELDGGTLLDWHRQKAGTIEHVHDAVKNHLGGGHVPGALFGAGAAWFKLALMAYNLLSAVRGLALGSDALLAHAEAKKIRYHLVHLSGRMNRFGCKLKLRFCATAEQIGRVLRIWKVFDLPTQATAFR